MGCITFLWGLYLRLLGVLGHGILIAVAFALCAFTLIDQFHAMDDTARNAALFVAGFAVIASTALRRWIWMLIGLTVPWLVLVAGAVRFLVEDHYRFTVTVPLLAIAFVPPLVLLVILELLPKPEIGPPDSAADPTR